jgi:hypothetical protein
LPQNREDDRFVYAHDVQWEKGVGRSHCPAATGGFSSAASFRLHNYEDKSELEYFLTCFPNILVEEICDLMSKKGREKFPNFSVTKGEFWLFMGIQVYILLHPMEGPKDDYWEDSASTRYEGLCTFVKHNLGQYGISWGRYKLLRQVFTLPVYHMHGAPDIFSPIRRFVDQWNNAMQAAVSPGLILVVDESMGQWLGKGMPGLMFVARKPTPNGREGHTLACAETGCILAYEVYEGKVCMASKEWVQELGSGAAIAMRMTKPWANSSRVVILDSAFASLKAAKALAGVGLFIIGNVKTAHTGYPKAWLNAQVTVREDRACASHTFEVNGKEWVAVAAIDKDKQPMSLIGTAGTTNMGIELVRNFTVKRSNGDWCVRTATLAQWHIHQLYRGSFNAVDVHNSKRQGGMSFEDTWKTHAWWVRDYQVLFGISEVNAFLLWRRFKPGMAAASLRQFRMALCHQLLHNSWLAAERGASQGAVAHGASTTSTGHHLVANTTKRRCRACGMNTKWKCVCCEDEDASGNMFLCSPSTQRRCLLDHVEGKVRSNRGSEGAAARWRKHARRHKVAHMKAGPNATHA